MMAVAEAGGRNDYEDWRSVDCLDCIRPDTGCPEEPQAQGIEVKVRAYGSNTSPN